MRTRGAPARIAARTAAGRSDAERTSTSGPAARIAATLPSAVRPVTQVKVEQDDVRVPAGPGEQRAHGRRGGDDPDVALARPTQPATLSRMIG